MSDLEPRLGALLAADFRRQRALQESRFGYAPMTWWLDPGVVVVVLFRLSHAANRRGWRFASRFAMQLNSLATGADFQPTSRIGGGLLVPSPCSTNLSCRAGRGLQLGPRSGIGGSLSTTDIGAGPGLPFIGDDMSVEQFAGVNGPIRIGDRVVATAGGGAIRDVPSDHATWPASSPIIGPGYRAAAPPCGAAPAGCGHAVWQTTWDNWRADVIRFGAEIARYDPDYVPRVTLGLALTNSLSCLLIQRTAHWLWCNGRLRAAAALDAFNRFVFKLGAPADTCLGGGLLLPHLAGVVVAGRVGAGATIYANAIVAPLCAGGAGPVLGDGVVVGGHGGVIGAIVLGAGARLAPKVQALQSLAAGDEAFSPLARIRDAARPPGQPVSTAAALPTVPPRAAQAAYRALVAADRAVASERGRDSRGGAAGTLALRLHRLTHREYVAGRRRRARLGWLANVYLTGADISPASIIGPGAWLPYPAGISFHGRAGARLTVMAMAGAGAAIDGADRLAALDASPVLGDDVTLDHHALVFGARRIGSRVHVQPGCAVTTDVEDDRVVSARPLRIRSSAAPVTVARR